MNWSEMGYRIEHDALRRRYVKLSHEELDPLGTYRHRHAVVGWRDRGSADLVARPHIQLGERQVLQIPRTAVRRVGQIFYVYRVVGDTRVERAFIQVAGEHGAHLAVASGLSAGDRLVADPNRLKDERRRE